MTPDPTQAAGPEEARSPDRHAVAQAAEILEAHRIMAISTVRPDGWPQTTIVGYASEGLTVYFMILRSSQKYANIQRDDRVSIAVGAEPTTVGEAKAVFAGAHAAELTDAGERRRVWDLLVRRHPNLASYQLPDGSDAVVMRATCRYLSIVDYTQGLGHTEAFSVNEMPAPAASSSRT